MQCFIDLSLKTETFDECCEGYGVRLVTPLENLGQYRETEIDLTHMTETIHVNVQSKKVRLNSLEFQSVRKGNSSGLVLHLRKGI